MKQMGLIFLLLTALQLRAADAPIRAGMIGLDTSHVPAFTKIFNDPKATGDVAGIRVTVGYPGGTDMPASRDRVEKFTEQLRQMGVEIVDSIPKLLEKVDVVLLESVDGRIHLQEATPVLKAGKPLFIDKPVAGTLADAVAIYQLARQHKTPCFSSSSLRFHPGIQELLQNEKLDGMEGAATWGPCSYQEGTPDLFFYGIHGIEPLFALMGTGCETVTRAKTKDTDLVTGVWKNGRIGTYRGIRSNRADFGATAYGRKAILQATPGGGYAELCREIGRFFKTRKPPVSAEETIEIFAFMEAAEESVRQGGAPVSLASVLAKAKASIVPDKPYAVLRCGPVQAVVVDNQAVDDAVLAGHRAGYHGIAALTHEAQPRNLFVPAYAGLNFEHIHDGRNESHDVLFEPRRAPMQLRVINEFTAELHQPPTPYWGLESWSRYALLEDGVIELTFECIPRRVTWKNNYLGLFWASYIDKPESLDIHFLDTDAKWVRGITPSHGARATHRAADDAREFAHDADFPLELVFNFSTHRFAEPWYFGACRGMAFAQIFRPADQVRLSQSPSGGGAGNPAWDFQWFIPDPKVGKKYQLVMRALYTPLSKKEELRQKILARRTR